MRRRLAPFLVFATALLANGCDRDTVPVALSEFCRVDASADGRTIRATAHLVTSHHGWFLVDAACPDRTIGWRTTSELRAAKDYPEFEAAAWSTLSNMSAPPQDVLIEFTGVLRWQRQTVEVHSVQSFEVTGAALPYVDEGGHMSAHPPE